MTWLEKFRMWSGLIVFGFFVLLFARAPVTRFLTGTQVPADPVTGEWIGRLKVIGADVPSMFGSVEGPHKTIAIRFTLAESDGASDRYAGPGELTVIGDGVPRALKIDDLRSRADGTITVRLSVNSFSMKFDGSLNAGEMTWHNDGTFGFAGSLKRGTDSDYEALKR